MYRALYRKWRPQRFEDVVGQKAIVAALKNQVATGRVGHAYLFTGVRGTGKTTCAKIFAKAVNCLSPHGGDPCGECEICRGIDNGSILDVVEMDAASNNSVDDVRDIRDETAYTPSICKYKVYIIDEVHMLSASAFNALLKTLEEPPSHVIFILATTEIQKVPATILSRCQRYDFTRIRPEDIAERVEAIAAAENLKLTSGAAALVARLADGALRDALSILDTCAGVTDTIDEEVVRRMAGVTDKSYLFRISDAIAAKDGGAALAELAELRQQSVDVKRLAEELVSHYRNLMLAGLPGGKSLLAGVSEEEEALYLEKAAATPQAEAIRAIRTIGSAMEKMARGNNHRIELELALFSLTEGALTMQPVPAAQPAAAAPAAASAAPRPFASAPQTVQPFASAPAAKQPEPAPVPQPAPAAQAAPSPTKDGDAPVKSAEAPPWETQPSAPAEIPQPKPEPEAQAEQPAAESLQAAPESEPEPENRLEQGEPPTEEPAREQNAAPKAAEPAAQTDSAAPAKPTAVAAAKPAAPQPAAGQGIQLFAPWEKVVKVLEERDPMLYGTLRKSKAYYDGRYVLIDGGKMFRDFIRANRDSRRLLKKVIAEVADINCNIGPYEPKTDTPTASNAEQTLQNLQKQGLDVVVRDSENSRR
jgi:DNA polymerase-3 subunit gamma/tau